MLVAVPSTVDTILMPLSSVLAKAHPGGVAEGRRLVYFETSREGEIDREGEDIAADALWASRRHFIEQGNLDIGHFSWLGNPRGTGMRPEYVVGLPVDVRRNGPSIYVQGEIFSNIAPPPERMDLAMDDPTALGSNGGWADRFWHSLTGMRPPMRWFPSVLGKMHPGGVEMQIRNGKRVRFITGPMVWFSVAFAQRAQHPTLGPVSTDALGTPFATEESMQGDLIAKAVQTGRPAIDDRVMVLTPSMFAKAVDTASVVTSGDPHALDSKATLGGTTAIRRESLEGAAGADVRRLYQRLKPKVMRSLLTGKIDGSIRAVAEAFRKAGAPEKHAHAFAVQLGEEADEQVQRMTSGGAHA